MPKYKNRQCDFTKNNVLYIDYKDKATLRRYVSQYWKIIPSYYTGTSVKYQKMLSQSIKRARQMALIPYTRY